MSKSQVTVEEHILQHVADDLAWRRDMLSRPSDSPIEELFAFALTVTCLYEQFVTMTCPLSKDFQTRSIRRIVRGDGPGGWTEQISVSRQVPIGRYKADFAVNAKYSTYVTTDDEHGDINGIAHHLIELPTIIVECDGHDFHERTKEQAAHDRSRDREMSAMGFAVLRFTGQEIYRDACKCVAGLFDEISSQVKRYSNEPPPETAEEKAP